MSKEKKNYVFIIQNDDGSLAAGRQLDVDTAIKNAEDSDQDIEFKVIGRILEAKPKSLTLDFNEQQIEWYEEGEKESPFIKKAVIAIANFITYLT